MKEILRQGLRLLFSGYGAADSLSRPDFFFIELSSMRRRSGLNTDDLLCCFIHMYRDMFFRHFSFYDERQRQRGREGERGGRYGSKTPLGRKYSPPCTGY